MSGQVRLAAHVVGDASVTVVAGPESGADVAWVSLRRHHGRVAAQPTLRQVRQRWDGPLLVEPFSADDLPAIDALADGVLVGTAWMQDFQLLRRLARLGRPVVVQRGQGATLEEWLSAAEYCVAEGNSEVILCETGSTHLPVPAPDLALSQRARERSGLPMLVEVSAAPSLAAAAVAAGADGLLLGEDTVPADMVAVRDCAVTLAPLLRGDQPTSLAQARAAIDRVDAALAVLLEHRAGLAHIVQEHKPVGGFAGRDRARERQIVAAMARRAPRLGAQRLARIMDVVIAAGLEAFEEQSAGRAHPSCV